MNILSYKFGSEELRAFELNLSKLNELDKQITQEIQEIEEESAIFQRKFLLKVRKINPAKINLGLLKSLRKIFSNFIAMEGSIFTGLKSIKEKFSPLDKYEEKLFLLLNTTSRVLFSEAKQAVKNVDEIIAGLELDPNREGLGEELAEEFEKLESHLNPFRKLINELVLYSELWEKESKKKPYLNAKIIAKTEEYKKDCSKYSSWIKNILEVETKIQTYSGYTKNLHEKLIHGKLKGKLHARISENLRIIYSWDPQKAAITYEKIITKNEMEKN